MGPVPKNQEIVELPNLDKIWVLPAENHFVFVNTPLDMLDPHAVAGITKADPAWRNRDFPRYRRVHGERVVEQRCQVRRFGRRHLGLQVAEYLQWGDSVDGDRLEAVVEAPEAILE